MSKLIRPIFFILLLAFLLRLIAIETRNLWYDEAFAVLFAEKGIGTMLYGTLTPVEGGAADIHPLLYYTTLNLWMSIFGQSALAVRLWSVLLGIAAIYIVYLIGRKLFGERTGLTGAFITAIVPFHVQYSQETRMYSLMALLLIGTTWCFIKGWHNGVSNSVDHDHAKNSQLPFIQTWGWWIAFGILSGLAMYTQQLSAFYLAALGLVPLVLRRRDLFIRTSFSVVIALIVYAPWLVNIPSQLDKVRSYYWIQPPGIAQLLVTIRSFMAGYLEFNPALSILLFALSVILVVFLALQVIFWLRRPRRDQSERSALLFVLWLFAAPLILMWLVSQIQPVYLERGLTGSALLLYIALAWLFTRSGLPRLIVGILGAAGIVIVVIGLYTHYTWARFPNSPFREALDHIRANWQEGDVIVHQDKLSALPMIYYDRSSEQRFLRDEPGSPDDTLALPTQEALQLLADNCIQQAAENSSRIWFVVFDRAEREYSQIFEQTGESVLNDQFEWLDSTYTPTGVEHFNDLNVYLYTDPTAFSAACPA